MTDLLAAAGGSTEPLQALLVGGYFGTWVESSRAFRLRLAREDLRSVGCSLGSGVLIALGESACGLHESARVIDYLAGAVGRPVRPVRVRPARDRRLVRRARRRRRPRARARPPAALDGRGPRPRRVPPPRRRGAVRRERAERVRRRDRVASALALRCAAGGAARARIGARRRREPPAVRAAHGQGEARR